MTSGFLHLLHGETHSAPNENPEDFTTTFNCNVSLGTGYNFRLHGIAIAAILAVSLLGGLLPWLLRFYKVQAIFFFCSVFAGGILVSTAFVRILPKASANLTSPCLGLSAEFPWAYIICGLAMMTTFTIEYYLRALIRKILSKKYSLSDDLIKVMVLSHDFSSFLEMGVANTAQTEMSLVQRAQIRDQRVASYMLLAGVELHCFWIGIDIGVTRDTDLLIALMVGIIFQQAFEGLAVGSSFIRAHLPSKNYFYLLCLFVLTCPVGIAIGIGLSDIYNHQSKVTLGLQGGFNAASAGILLYNGWVDILLPAFTSADILVSRIWWRLLATVALFAGFGVMCVISIWA